MTLTELLVVACAIGVLASMLLPYLGGAWREARLVLCKGQLRRWGLAFQTYASFNDGYWPHCDGLDRDGGPADEFGWIDLLPPLMNERPWREYARGQHPKSDTVFQCPAAELCGGRYRYRPLRDGYFSYAMNSCLELDENCYRAPGDEGKAMPSFLQTERIVEPERVVLLFDQSLDPDRGYGGSRLNPTAGKHCGGYPKDFAVRHPARGARTGGLILYCDYSVRWAETVWKPHWPDDMKCPPRDDPDWFPYPME